MKDVKRQRAANALRQEGYTFGHIAERLDYANEASARKAVYQALGAVRADTNETAEQLRQIELDRLDAMHRSLWRQRGDSTAVTALLKIMERRAKLLGLDAPRVISGPFGGPLPAAAVYARELLLRKINEMAERLRSTEPPPSAVNPSGSYPMAG